MRANKHQTLARLRQPINSHWQQQHHHSQNMPHQFPTTDQRAQQPYSHHITHTHGHSVYGVSSSILNTNCCITGINRNTQHPNKQFPAAHNHNKTKILDLKFACVSIIPIMVDLCQLLNMSGKDLQILLHRHSGLCPTVIPILRGKSTCLSFPCIRHSAPFPSNFRH